MSAGADKLGNFLREVSNWDWETFVLAERDEETYTTNEAIIFALIRACAMQKLDAIRLAINRLDGKLKTPVRIEYPKVFYLYPNATLPPGSVTYSLESSQTDAVTEGLGLGTNEPRALVGEVIEAPEPEEVVRPDLPSMGFRETLALMSDHPRQIPKAIVETALRTERALNGLDERPPADEIPRVKSVVAAHLLILAQNRNLDAISDVFDSIDGKLVETLQVLGEDMYIVDYSNVAPPDALPNKDGILQVESVAVATMWEQKLKKELKQ